jgi:hypothetical protein
MPPIFFHNTKAQAKEPSMQATLNLTQHSASPEQIAAGVVDLSPEDQKTLSSLLTFLEIPSKEDMRQKAISIAQLVKEKDPNVNRVMIGGAPYFMSTLEDVLKDYELNVVYAFSIRESVDFPDGTKRSVFKHIGFVDV